MAFDWWFTAPIDAINAIGETVAAIPADILTNLITLVIALVYPFSLMVYYLQNIYTLMYNIFIPYINVMIIIANLPITIINLFGSIPVSWITLFYMSATLSLTVRLWRWLRTIPVFGRYILGTGDSP